MAGRIRAMAARNRVATTRAGCPVQTSRHAGPQHQRLTTAVAAVASDITTVRRRLISIIRTRLASTGRIVPVVTTVSHRRRRQDPDHLTVPHITTISVAALVSHPSSHHRRFIHRQQNIMPTR